MERRPDAPSWRASLGLIVTGLAAVFLALVVWRAYSLNRSAGSSVAALHRERIALAFERLAYPLTVDMSRFRLNVELTGPPAYGPGLRARIDGELSRLSAFERANDAALQTRASWNRLAGQWAAARKVKPVYHGRLLPAMLNGLLNDVIYHVEDSSGIEYEPNKYAQDLGDIAFAKIPLAASIALDTDRIVENADAARTISIPNRIRLAGDVLSLTPDGGDIDFSGDDWPAIMQNVARLRMGSTAEGRRFSADYASLRAAGGALATLANSGVVMRNAPAGDAAVSRRLTRNFIAAMTAMNGDVLAMFDRSLAARASDEDARNRYLYLAFVLGAVLLVGIMLLVAEMTARRDRHLLQQAKQESERLTAELARRNAERALRLSEAQFRAVFDGAAMGIAVLDKAGVILDANAVFRNVYGENGVGVLEGHDREFTELMRGERELFEFEQHVMTPAGQEAWTDSTISLVTDENGNPYFAICMFRDLTDLKRNERRMQHDLTHDALTGLPNRGLFEARVREQFAETQTKPQTSFAVLFVDVDRFKDINESLGHDAGDFVLSQVGHRLRAAIEAADVVARLGSDEFAVLVRSLPDVLHVEVIARRVLSALAKPVALGSRSIFISASVGIALASGAYQRGEDVMRDADIAMRYAKSGGGSRFAIFDSKMHARAEKRLQLTTDLRLALEHGEFDLLYQPIVRISDAQLVGCEALLRWNHPVEGIMLPIDFMPLAEQTGLAVPIGRFVLRTACQQLARWKRMVGQKSLFPVNVNVSAAELLDADFEATLLAAIREFSVSPEELTLEITESVVLDAGTRPNALVEKLRTNGFRICIDDFGTGYSSLRYLQQFKVDAIKIDRSFVSGQDGDVASEPIVRTLMTLAEAFDVRVVAEGIETPRQRDVLRNAGCRYGQGYFYSRAISAGELAAMHPSVFGVTPRHASA